MVVEDNADDSLMLLRRLKTAHLEDNVTVIADGAEALKFLMTADPLPLAVFLDLWLPGLTGIEVLEHVRQDQRLNQLPVIIMTGSINPNDEDRCRQLGAAEFLAKPVELGTFIKIITSLFPERGSSGV